MQRTRTPTPNYLVTTAYHAHYAYNITPQYLVPMNRNQYFAPPRPRYHKSSSPYSTNNGNYVDRMSSAFKLSDEDLNSIYSAKCPTHIRKIVNSSKDSQSAYLRAANARQLPLSTNPSQPISTETIEEQTKLPSTSTGELRVLQYNVLAKCYTDVSRYAYCPSENLSWDEYRKYNIAKEILQYNPDIITLQEVDDAPWFDKVMNTFDYNGIYKRRPNSYKDGLALYFKNSKYEIVDTVAVNFNDHIQPDGFSDRTKTNNIALIVHMKEKSTGASFVVATSHIYWDPKLSFLKVRQSFVLLKQIEMFLQSRGLDLDTPLIVTGDFNSTPWSAVYELYQSGKVAGNHSDMLDRPSPTDFNHNLDLTSAYHILDEPYTNVTPGFTETLDYIWFTSKSLKLTGVLDLLSQQQYNEYTALPSPLWSSDHLSLCAEFSFNNTIL